MIDEETTLNQEFNSPKPEERSRVSNIAIGFLLVVAAFLAYNFFSNNQGQTTSTNTLLSVTATPKAEVTNKVTDNSETKLDQTDEDLELGDGEYVIKEGDTLWKIAENELSNGFLWQEIADLNKLSENEKLAVGSRIRLPEVVVEEDQTTADGSLVEEEDLVTDAEANNQGIGAPDVLPAEETITGSLAGATDLSETPETAITEGMSEQVYVIQKGDTLWSIALKFYGDGSQWTQIFEQGVNNLSMYQAQDGHVYPIIHTGNVLVIPGVGVN